MKITTQQELNNLIATADESNTIVLHEDLEITFDCEIPCNIKVFGDINARNIKAHNITTGNIKAWNIKAWNITTDNIEAHNIKAHNITAYDINAHNINAYDITTGNIKAWNIEAHNIKAHNIKSRNIEYYALCIAYESLKCESISGTRENSLHKCLDQEIEIIKEEKVTIELTQEQLDKIKHLI